MQHKLFTKLTKNMKKKEGTGKIMDETLKSIN